MVDFCFYVSATASSPSFVIDESRRAPSHAQLAPMDVDHILIAGMRHIRILLPLEILGHLAVLALSQILIHAIRGNVWCASSWLVLQSCLLQRSPSSHNDHGEQHRRHRGDIAIVALGWVQWV
jgi:hypothetical protein